MSPCVVMVSPEPNKLRRVKEPLNIPNRNIVHAVASDDIASDEVGYQPSNVPTLSLNMNISSGIDPKSMKEAAVTRPFMMDVL